MTPEEDLKDYQAGKEDSVAAAGLAGTVIGFMMALATLVHSLGWIWASVIMLLAFIAFVTWACVKVGADSEKRLERHDEHDGGLPL